MIDAHCHLEQKDYDEDRDEFIESLKKELKAVVTCCAHPQDFELTLEIVRKHKNFVFPTAGIHPTYVKEFSLEQVEEFCKKIAEHKDEIIGIGEVGLDYYWIKEEYWRKKQEELFTIFIELAQKLKKPLVIHSRDATQRCVEILEEYNCKHVLMHLFSERKCLERVKENGWYISIGPIIARSKTHKKIARDFPLERILLETDSPWFGFGKRGTPLNIKIAAEKIAQVKKLSFEEVWKTCGENAIRFYGLRISK